MTAGWIILDKDSGIFSRSAGGRIARMFGIRKFGHIGTLDPMASGVLPIALGDATKMIPFVEDVAPAIKEYLFSMQFGFETDTLDVTGRTILRDDFVPDTDNVLRAASQFIGEYMQTPPIYSAVHVDGRRAYELARRGASVTPAPRRVVIHELDFIGRNGMSWHFRARVGRGTYIRAIARDIAAMCGAHATVDMIRRTESNGFRIQDAVKLDFLENLVNNGANVDKYLHSSDFGLGDIPVLDLGSNDAVLYRNGGFVGVDACDGPVRVYSGGDFIGIGTVTGGILRPKRTI